MGQPPSPARSLAGCGPARGGAHGSPGRCESAAQRRHVRSGRVRHQPVVIGLTVVAVGTSLPELATSVTSTIRDEADVAFGNVIGSNVFNILAVLGTVALIHPFEISGLRNLDLAVMVASASLLLPLMWRGSVLNRWEGVFLLAGYAVFMYSLVP